MAKNDVNNQINTNVQQTESKATDRNAGIRAGIKNETEKKKNSSKPSNKKITENSVFLTQILNNFIVVATKFFNSGKTFFKNKQNTDYTNTLILKNIQKILEKNFPDQLKTDHATLVKNLDFKTDEKEFYQMMNRFLKTLPTDSVYNLQTKLTNIEKTLNNLTLENASNTTVTPLNNSEEIANKFLETYKPVMDQFNDALKTTADELLAFKTKIIYEQGERLNYADATMDRLFTEFPETLNSKFETIIEKMNNMFQEERNSNPLEISEITQASKNILSACEKNNEFLNNIFEKVSDIASETNSKEEQENTDTSTNNIPVKQDVSTPYNYESSNITDAEYLAEIIEYVYNHIDTNNGYESPIEYETLLDEKIDKVISNNEQNKNKIINDLLTNTNDVTFIKFSESFSAFSQNVNETLNKITGPNRI